MTYPGSSEELRRIAIGSVREAFENCGRELVEGDPLPAELVDLVDHFNLPLSVLVSYVHFHPRKQEVSAEAFARHCKKFMQAPAERDREAASSDAPGICPSCNAYPMQRVGAFLVCASGRCAPRLNDSGNR